MHWKLHGHLVQLGLLVFGCLCWVPFGATGIFFRGVLWACYGRFMGGIEQ